LVKPFGGDEWNVVRHRGAKVVEAEQPDAVDLGLDRLAIG